MCGIAGILNSSINLKDESQRNILKQVSETLKMRGPDEHGEYITENTALLHRRLAIVDIENGKQPMHFGKYVITYNGEIYNTEELRKELTALGENFDTHSDTEVVLKSFAVWKEKSFEKLNGIFAFAIYDKEENELYAVRDKMGVKPFYYYFSDDTFAFASRVPSLLKFPQIKPVVDETGLMEMFMLGPAFSPDKTVFKNIRQLKPSHFLKFKNNELTIKKYWSLKAKPHGEDLSDTIEHTHFLVRDSIKRQMVSDVDLCAFLSGGLDSSIICKVMSDELKKQGKTLSTYSVDYAENDKYFQKSSFQPNKDSDFIDLISDNIGSNHKNIVLDNKSVAKALIDSAVAKGYPAFADVDSSLLLFCKEVKKDYKVCLSGECADEIFGGYPWYHNKDILFEETFPWSRSTNVRQKILKKGVLTNTEEYVHEKYLQTVNETDFLDTDTSLDRRMREMFMLNLNWFMQTLLMRKDTMSMESSLEIRVPFCDTRLVEYAYNMPWEFKSLYTREKGIVRKAFENELPYDIAWRKKSPYPKTHNPIFFNTVCDMTKEILQDKSSVLFDMINIETVNSLMENPDCIKEPWYGQLMKGPQILAYIIQIYYFIKEYNVEFEL